MYAPFSGSDFKLDVGFSYHNLQSYNNNVLFWYDNVDDMLRVYTTTL